MDSGTLPAWASAAGTVAATIVALYLGGRDDEARRGSFDPARVALVVPVGDEWTGQVDAAVPLSEG